jgi:hypothetical protein
MSPGKDASQPREPEPWLERGFFTTGGIKRRRERVAWLIIKFVEEVLAGDVATTGWRLAKFLNGWREFAWARLRTPNNCNERIDVVPTIIVAKRDRIAIGLTAVV